MKNKFGDRKWRDEIDLHKYYKEISYEDIDVGVSVFQAKLSDNRFKGGKKYNNKEYYYLIPSEFARTSHKRSEIEVFDKLTIVKLKSNGGQKFITSIRDEERVQANFKTISYSYKLERDINKVISSYMGGFSVLYGDEGEELTEAQDKMNGRKRNHLSSQKDSPLGIEVKKDMDTDFYHDNFGGMF